MKHVWVCHRAPYLDKVINGPRKTQMSAYIGQITFHAKDSEKIVMTPGTYVCEVCGAIQVANYPPPSDWDGTVTPICNEELVRRVMDS